MATLFLKSWRFQEFPCTVQLDVQEDRLESFCSFHVPNITWQMSGDKGHESQIIGHLSLQSEAEAQYSHPIFQKKIVSL
jgi:hypothetical protein